MGNYPGMLVPALPPCHRSPNRAFTDPDRAPARSVRAALRMCEHCPMRRSCAREALTAGTSLDGGFTAPATGVVMAGVICHGTQDTATELARVAGTRPPSYTMQAPRGRVPSHCRECRHPMSSWTRNVEDIPPGHVQHYARGWCVHCRPAYSRALEAEKASEGDTLRKRVDRRNRVLETAVARTRTRGRREGWSEERLAEEVALAEMIVAEEKARRSAATRRAREEEGRRIRAEAEAAGWALTTREVAELVGVTKEVVNNRGHKGLLSRRRWPGVAGYLYRLDDVVEMWPDA